MDWRGWILPRWGGRKPPAESLNPPRSEDLEQLKELELRGSRVNLPHPVRAFLDFQEEAVARSAGELLEADGFRCQVRNVGEGGWMLTAISQLVPTPGAITHLRERMEELADRLGGSYRGWEAPVVS